MRRNSLKSAVLATLASMHPRRAARNHRVPPPTGRAAVLSLTLALTLLCADAARANSLTVRVSQVAEPVGTSIVSVEGTADLPATLPALPNAQRDSCWRDSAPRRGECSCARGAALCHLAR